MNDRTLRALRDSIRHWERVVSGEDKSIGVGDCALCGLFFKLNCSGCPVSEKVNNIRCRDTPYRDYASGGKRREDAVRELEFLRSLLPAEEQKP